LTQPDASGRIYTVAVAAVDLICSIITMEVFSMLEELKTARKVVGIKQSIRAVKDGSALVAYIAQDADRHVIQQLEALCDEKSIKTVRVNTMEELGKACGIEVKAASAVVLK